AAYHVPLDQPLPDHTRITRLRLAAEGGTNVGQLWPDLVLAEARDERGGAASDSGGGTNVIELERGTRAEPEAIDRLLTATDLHPADDPALRALARVAVTGAATEAAQVAALTRYVHGFLRYRADAPSRPVRGLLDAPEGDCTEFADLLTTLARSVGLPARTVFGLAYADGPKPAFAFHAWNEIKADGVWHVVDPTWNQLMVDATHLPLPADVATTLTWLTGSGTLRFRVLAARY
ncbi:MAG: transglutaminase-like domain-containing protein, partial [Gammaproteobacteria bacterium]